MARSDGARQWAIVLSELAGVRVAVEWERPAWRVRWVDGPTRLVLMDRAAALSRYRVGAPLTAQDMRFARSSSGLARALAWLTLADQAGLPGAVDRVERLVEDTGYPQNRADGADLAAAELLNRLSGGESVQMGRLLAAASPPVPPRPSARSAADLAGEVVSFRWPIGGPPAELLGGSTSIEPLVPSDAGAPEELRTCARCHTPLPPTHGRGRPARFCGGACRVAAHRASRRGQRSTDRGSGSGTAKDEPR
jgi:hypothetical protein